MNILGEYSVDYELFEGFDHYSNKPLFQVCGINNDYVGEWHTDKNKAEEELLQCNNTI